MQPDLSTNKNSPDSLMEETHRAAARGDLETVLSLLWKIQAIKPLHPESNAHLGWLLSQQGAYGTAFLCYLRLLVVRPWIPQVYLRTAQCLWFLVRRGMSDIIERFPILQPIHSATQSILFAFNSFLTRILEFYEHRPPVLSSWMKHHRRTIKETSVNSYEYYKPWEIQFAVRSLSGSPPLSILDMGSGRSGFPSFLAACGHDVFALDLDTDGLTVQNRLSQIRYGGRLFSIMGNFLCLPFRQKHFDAITLISAIEHIPDEGDIQTLHTLAAFLRDGGDLIVTVPAASIYSEHWTSFQIGHVYEELRPQENARGFLRVYDPPALQNRLISPSGLHTVRITYYGELNSWGWLGMGRNYVGRNGTIYPSLFLSPLGLLLVKELSEKELPSAHWAVACIHFKKV